MIRLEVWLYGSLAGYARDQGRAGHACLHPEVPEGTRMAALLERLGIPVEEKGITFVNAQLTDMPGLAADLDLELRHGDRIGIFHRQSMWPFQYRFGATTGAELRGALQSRDDRGLRHSTAPIPIVDAGGGEGGDPPAPEK